MEGEIKDIIQSSIEIKRSLMDAGMVESIGKVVDAIVTAFKSGNQVLLCGNGGSAADAQHIASELSGKFYKDRPALNAEALHVNSSYLTAVANDYGYAHVFARAIEAKGKKGDILIAMSTSGKSENVVQAVAKAKELGMVVIAMTGQENGLAEYQNIGIEVASTDTPRVQECHLLIGHIIAEQVEKIIFN